MATTKFEGTDEELVHELGMMVAAPAKDKERVFALTTELVRRGVLFEDDDRGIGWRVIADCGSIMPEKHLVFRYKGLAWIYWYGAGRPYGSRLLATADPMVEYREMLAEGPIDVGDIQVVPAPRPPLRVVEYCSSHLLIRPT